MKAAILFSLSIVSIAAIPLKISPVPISRQLLKSGGRGRIVGGSEAKEQQFPWQVAVYFDTNDGTYFCGGALVAYAWVLTAGHCTYHATIFTLHLGSNSLVDDDPNRVTVAATYSVVHPDYVPTSLEHDVGLIRIDQAYTHNDHIKTIALDNLNLPGQQNIIVSGWGASGDWDGVVNELNYVELVSITNEECKETYGETTISDGMLCAVSPVPSGTEGICDGDSGSPLVHYDTIGQWLHVGIASWTSSAGCKTDHPSGYTRTSVYLDWILAHAK